MATEMAEDPEAQNKKMALKNDDDKLSNQLTEMYRIGSYAAASEKLKKMSSPKNNMHSPDKIER